MPTGNSRDSKSRDEKSGVEVSALLLVELKVTAVKRASKKFFAGLLKAMATVDGMSQLFPYIPAVLTVRTTVNVFRLRRQPSMDVNILVYGQARCPELIHFRIKPPRMSRIKQAVV